MLTARADCALGFANAAGQAEALARQRAAAVDSAARPSQSTVSSTPFVSVGSDVQNTAYVPAVGLDQTLDRLALSATDFTRQVKDAVCHEVIDSERQSTPGLGPRVLPAHVQAVSELQVEVHDAHVEEHRKWISQDGRPLAAGQSANLPYNLSQAFAVPPSAFLSREHRSCLRFSTQQTGRINFQATPMAGKGACADVGPQATGYILFQPGADLISHIERCSASTTLSDQRQLFLPKNDIYTFTVISFQRHLRLFPMKRLEAQGGARSRRLVHRGRLRLTAPGQARGHCCGPAPADNWVC